MESRKFKPRYFNLNQNFLRVAHNAQSFDLEKFRENLKPPGFFIGQVNYNSRHTEFYYAPWGNKPPLLRLVAAVRIKAWKTEPGCRCPDESPQNKTGCGAAGCPLTVYFAKIIAGKFGG